MTPQMTIWRRVARWIIKATLAQVHCRTRARAHTHTHTHTHTKQNSPHPQLQYSFVNTSQRYDIGHRLSCLKII